MQGCHLAGEQEAHKKEPRDQKPTSEQDPPAPRSPSGLSVVLLTRVVLSKASMD